MGQFGVLGMCRYSANLLRTRYHLFEVITGIFTSGTVCAELHKRGPDR